MFRMNEVLDGIGVCKIDDFSNLKELFEELTKEPSVEEVYKDYLNQLKEAGIGDIIDKKSLKKAVKNMIENDKEGIKIANVPDVDNEAILESLEPDELEANITLNLADLSLLIGIFDSYKPQKMLKRLVKNNIMVDHFGTYLLGEVQIDKLKTKFDKAQTNILLKAANKINGEKVTFKAE